MHKIAFNPLTGRPTYLITYEGERIKSMVDLVKLASINRVLRIEPRNWEDILSSHVLEDVECTTEKRRFSDDEEDEIRTHLERHTSPDSVIRAVIRSKGLSYLQAKSYVERIIGHKL